MENLVGFVASAGLFVVSDYFDRKQKAYTANLLSNMIDLNATPAATTSTTNKNPCVAFVTPTKPVHIITLRQQTLQPHRTLAPVPVLRLDNVTPNEAEKRNNPVEVQLQEQVISRLAYTHKTKFVTDTSFGQPKDRVSPNAHFVRDVSFKKWGQFPVSSTVVYDGGHMSTHLLETYKTSTVLIPTNLYQAKTRDLMRRPVYLFGQQFGNQFIYSKITSDPNRLVKQSVLPFVGQGLGAIGMIASVTHASISKR